MQPPRRHERQPVLRQGARRRVHRIVPIQVVSQQIRNARYAFRSHVPRRLDLGFVAKVVQDVRRVLPCAVDLRIAAFVLGRDVGHLGSDLDQLIPPVVRLSPELRGDVFTTRILLETPHQA